MSDQGSVVTLPNAQEIIRRLQRIDPGDAGNMESDFFPLIAQEAGRTLVAKGIVTMLHLKIYQFVLSGYPPEYTGILNCYIPEIIDVLIDDKEVAENAKNFHEHIMEQARRG